MTADRHTSFAHIGYRDRPKIERGAKDDSSILPGLIWKGLIGLEIGNSSVKLWKTMDSLIGGRERGMKINCCPSFYWTVAKKAIVPFELDKNRVIRFSRCVFIHNSFAVCQFAFSNLVFEGMRDERDEDESFTLQPIVSSLITWERMRVRKRKNFKVSHEFCLPLLRDPRDFLAFGKWINQ